MKILKELIKKILLICIILLLIWILLMFLYSLFYKITGLYKTNLIFKSKEVIVFIADDNIMSPQVKKDDVVVIRKVENEDDLKIKDIIYIQDGQNKKLAQIENIRINDKNEKYYTTKGIKNYYYNPNDVQIDNIQGKLDKTYKGITLSFRIATSNAFSIIMSIILIIILYIMIQNEIRRKRRRTTRVKLQKNGR